MSAPSRVNAESSALRCLATASTSRESLMPAEKSERISGTGVSSSLVLADESSSLFKKGALPKYSPGLDEFLGECGRGDTESGDLASFAID